MARSAAVTPQWVRARRSRAVTTVVLRSADATVLRQISDQMGLGLSLPELRAIQRHYRAAGRDPSDLELQAFGQAWSEHCCYKSSKPYLRKYLFALRDDCTLAKGDAGVVAFDERWAYALRIESHNHPSAVEPYGGAATGIGGIVRDVLAMGAFPAALIDPLFFGPLDLPREQLPPGVLHPRALLGGVVAGIRDYGNRIGIPTVAGSVTFDARYTGNCLVNVGCLGMVQRAHIQPNAVGGVGDRYVLLGGATGRDGIHGVTFASRTLSSDATSQDRSSVQLGDPITKEPLLHVIEEVVAAGLARGIKDLGGGGLSCVVGEMALARNLGAVVDLDRVPLKERGLAPWEVWVSESQERMMVAARPKDVSAILAIAKRWDVLATEIGRVIRTPVMRVRWHGRQIAQMDLPFLTGGPVYDRPTRARRVRIPLRLPPRPTDVGALLLRLLAHPNVCSREWVVRQYDHTVRGATTIQPLQGIPGRAAHGDAAVITPVEGTDRSLAIAVASAPTVASLDPYAGGLTTIDEVARNLCAVGAQPHALTNCLNFGSPEVPENLWEFSQVVRGLRDGAAALGVSFPSGNVSFYNETSSGSIPPTAVVAGVGMLDHLHEAVTTDLKGEDHWLLHLGVPSTRIGGSEYLAMCGGSAPVCRPDLRLLRRCCRFLRKAAVEGRIAAAHDVSHGGLAVTVAEMALGGDVGATIDVGPILQRRMRPDVALFGENPTRWVLSTTPQQGRALLGAAADAQLPLVRIGRTGGRQLRLRGGGMRARTLPLRSIRTAWERTLWDLLGP